MVHFPLLHILLHFLNSTPLKRRLWFVVLGRSISFMFNFTNFNNVVCTMRQEDYMNPAKINIQISTWLVLSVNQWLLFHSLNVTLNPYVVYLSNIRRIIAAKLQIHYITFNLNWRGDAKLLGLLFVYKYANMAEWTVWHWQRRVGKFFHGSAQQLIPKMHI